MTKKRKNDILLILSLFLLVVIAALAFSLFGKQGDVVIVTQNGEIIAEYPLYENLKTDIISEQGKINTLVIENNTAYISYADCPDKICVSHRKISRDGELIVCLPHKLTVGIEASRK